MIRNAIIVVLTLAAVLIGISPILTVGRDYRVLLWHRGNPGAGLIVQREPVRLEAIYVHRRPPDELDRTLYHKKGLGFEVVIADAIVHNVDEGKECAEFSARIYAPVWCAVVLFAAYPLATFISGPVRRYRRRRRGLCTRCGYNLTGLTEPRCPECGTTVGSTITGGLC
jgi:hypothetical protein